MKEETEQQAIDNLAVVIERLSNIQAENSREHATIIEQVKRTNSTVADLVKWRYIITGALILMNIFVAPVIVAVLIKFTLNYIF